MHCFWVRCALFLRDVHGCRRNGGLKVVRRELGMSQAVVLESATGVAGS